MMNYKILQFSYLPLLCVLCSSLCMGQVNFLGKPGYIGSPSAEWQEERQLGLSFSYLPQQYSIFYSPEEVNTVYFYNARLGFTSFMEVHITVAHRPLMRDKIGVGDRQLDFRFRLLKEKKYTPSLVLGWTPPGSVSPVMSHDFLVATKHFDFFLGELEITAGYASPYVFLKNQSNKGIWDYLVLKPKGQLPNGSYLSGFFSGLSWKPFKLGGVMLEYDTQTYNYGAFIQPFEWLILQGDSYEGKEYAFHFSLQFPLNFAPRTLRRYEKELD